jgi:hypothetical protein
MSGVVELCTYLRPGVSTREFLGAKHTGGSYGWLVLRASAWTGACAVGGLGCDGKVLDGLDDWKRMCMLGLVRIGGLCEAQFWAVSICSVFLHNLIWLLH